MIPESADGETKVVLLLGSPGVGKRSLLQKYINGSFDEYTDKIPSSFPPRSITVNETRYHVDFQILELPPANIKAQRAADALISRADAFLLIYAINDIRSFQSIPDLYRHILPLRTANKSCPIFLLGTKSDLKYQRVISSEEADHIASSLNCEKFVEISANLHSLEIEELFTKAIEVIVGSPRMDPELHSKGVSNGQLYTTTHPAARLVQSQNLYGRNNMRGLDETLSKQSNNVSPARSTISAATNVQPDSFSNHTRAEPVRTRAAPSQNNPSIMTVAPPKNRTPSHSAFFIKDMASQQLQPDRANKDFITNLFNSSHTQADQPAPPLSSRPPRTPINTNGHSISSPSQLQSPRSPPSSFRPFSPGADSMTPSMRRMSALERIKDGVSSLRRKASWASISSVRKRQSGHLDEMSYGNSSLDHKNPTAHNNYKSRDSLVTNTTATTNSTSRPSMQSSGLRSPASVRSVSYSDTLGRAGKTPTMGGTVKQTNSMNSRYKLDLNTSNWKNGGWGSLAE